MLEDASRLGPFAQGATPPPGAIASIRQKSGASCPLGNQTLPGSGYIAQLCFEMYSDASPNLVIDVKLQAAGAPCPSSYEQIATFSGQAFCTRSMAVKNAVEVVTALYESNSCNSGDVLAGIEGSSTALCEHF